MILSLKKKVDPLHPHSRKQRLASKTHLADDMSTNSLHISNTPSINENRLLSTTVGQDMNAYVELNQNTYTDGFSTSNAIFDQLKSSNPEERDNAAQQLATTLVSIERELSAEQFQRFSTTLHNKIFELIHSPTPNEKIGGIKAVDVLISFYSSTEELPNQTSRLANYLRTLLPSNDLEVMKLAAQTLGRLAIPGNTITTDFVEVQVRTCLEWLTSIPESNSSGKLEYKKYAALLILIAIADNSPYLLYPYVDSILENIWRTLKETKLGIRLDAAELLGRCLHVLEERNIDNSKDQWVKLLYNAATDSAHAVTQESTHGMLLVYRELLKSSPNKFLKTKVTDIFNKAMSFKNHKLDVIRLEVYTILPLLASLDHKKFIGKYLDLIMTHYLTVLKNMSINSTISSDRPSIYVSIGEIAFHVKSYIDPYIKQILDNIRDALKSKSKVRKPYEKEIFYCISKLGVAMGPALAKYLHKELLKLILACTLSSYMEDTLKVLIENIPSLEHTINKKLLWLLSYYLSGQSFDHFEKKNESHPSITSNAQNWRNKYIFNKNDEPKDKVKDAQIIAQALRMMKNIKVECSLAYFARVVIISYCEHDNAIVRKLSILTTCDIFSKDHKISSADDKFSLDSVNEVLTKIIITALTDPVVDIRLEILKHLNSTFDSQLAQPDNARLLFASLKDEVFTIQKEAMLLLGRLSLVNPAYIVPLLRKTVLELTTELKYATWPRKKEESLILIKILCSFNKTIVEPYIHLLMSLLLENAKDNSSIVGCSALEAIAELSETIEDDMTVYLDELIKLIILILKDKANNYKKQVALKTLSKLASSTCYVISPLLDYGDLLGLLLGILKGDTSKQMSIDTLKLIGTLGALDPYKHREISITTSSTKETPEDSSNIDIDLLISGMSPSDENYYPLVVIDILSRIMSDSTYSPHHTAVVQCIMHIVQDMGKQSSILLDKMVPSLLSVMRSCPPSILEFYFQQLGTVITIVKEHMIPYVKDILKVVNEFLSIKTLQQTIVFVVEVLSKGLSRNFTQFVPATLSIYLNILDTDKSTGKKTSIILLKSLVSFGSSLENYSYLILPTIIRISEFATTTLRKAAIVTIGKLAKLIDLSDMISRIVQSLLRTLSGSDEDLDKAVMNTFCLLLLQTNTDFLIYIPIINRTLLQKHIQHSVYDQLVNKLMNNEKIPSNLINDKDSDETRETSEDYKELEKLPVNQHILSQSWNCSQITTKEAWQEWFRRFSIQLLKESPSLALRACSTLVNIPYPIVKELFNVSFASCWKELSENNQYTFTEALSTALYSSECPLDIHQNLLALIEYMEHNNTPLPISLEKLGEYSQKCNFYTKALYYKELEFKKDGNPKTIETLLSINNQLHQTDSAIGILKYAQNKHNLQSKEVWYEKLQRWEDALESYNERESSGEQSLDLTLGKMRSLYALGEWPELSALTDVHWGKMNLNTKKKVAPLAATAEWMLGKWSEIGKYVGILPKDTQNYEFIKAVLNIHSNNFNCAEVHLKKTRELIMSDISSLGNENYSRLYGLITRAQMVTELEEVTAYKQTPYNSTKRERIKELWTKRLLGVQRNVDTWQNLLQVRSIVLTPKEELNISIEFANLCRKSGRMNLSNAILNSLIDDIHTNGQSQTAQAPPSVIYAKIKYLWAANSQQEALENLTILTSKMVSELGLDANTIVSQSNDIKTDIPLENINDYKELLARCFLKQGKWMISLEPAWRTTKSDKILSSYFLATHFDPSSYKAWHSWALANFEVISTALSAIEEKDKSQKNKPAAVDIHEVDMKMHQDDPRLIHRHVVPAIQGFFHSISLSEASSMQDALRLLTLWFTFGGIPEASQAMHEGFASTKIGTWLEVLPQLISRIHQPNHIVSRSLLALLSDMGKIHPQALIYPLTVAIKSESISRRNAAQSIIDKMTSHSPILVQQGELVSNELIRVAVLWHEQWYEGLEEASRQYFGEHNVDKMLNILAPLYETLNKGPETLREISFQNAYGHDLMIAKQLIEKYQDLGEKRYIKEAWDIYYSIFRKISQTLPLLQTLELQHVSPNLLNVRDLELAIPGTYFIDKPVIQITEFHPSVSVISSKQRPRKITMKGSDGKDYQYALKGHEDIRQDSLVMQLFGLVNTLLQKDTESFKRHLDIQQFPAIPLSPKTGLLGWVSNSDTFHVLIKTQREANKVPLNIEHWIMLQMAPDYDNLTLLEKIEVFQYSMDNTKGDDMARALWLRSKSSEFWLERRTVYTRSLAVMSMVGYILGLGDRHPSNLMLDRTTGKVVHIDFGDCFESTILRSKFPEKVPFRLTRMLTNAMEIGGIEGSFRITSEHVMRVLRNNQESLIALLEAFASDPLIYWGSDLPKEKIVEQTGIDLSMPNPNELCRKGLITQDQVHMMELEQERKLKNARATLVLRRINDKLSGNDIPHLTNLDVPEQVDKLIQQATSIENLCQHYIGWCPFW
ncbi:serine/threonine-protein kinase Tor2p [Monosporozyma unispora]